MAEPRRSSVEIHFSPNKSAVSTPERNQSPINNATDNVSNASDVQHVNTTEEALGVTEDGALTKSTEKKEISLKDETKLFLQSEISSPSSKTERKTGTKILKSWSVIALTEDIIRHKYVKENGTLSKYGL